jgi:hypothetical protein
MVSNFTANEIGDSLIARLREPYSNVVRVTDWNIIAGVSNANTVGKLGFTQDSTLVEGINTNLNLQPGDKFIVGNLTFEVDQILYPTQFTITQAAPIGGQFNFYLPEDANNYFTYKYRWSQSELADGGEMSEFRDLDSSSSQDGLLVQTFNDTKPLWIDVRLEVDRLSSGHSLSLLSITFELETSDGIIESCPNWCEECTDPYAMDGCANIVIDCDDAVWNPYALKKPSSIYRQLSALTNEMWGHSVKYFRVEPDQRSRDVILKEYSLYNVVDESAIKIMVPDNSFPTREFNFDIFGMDFEEFEVHITGDAFTKAFGDGKEPRSRDYLYFPLINRMYEVSTVALADEFNLQMTYWRVQLRKWEDRTGSIHTDDAIEQEVDDLTVGVEEIFGEEIQDEFEKVTKPQQYKTVYQELEDDIRFSKHPSLSIVDAEIRNRWTLISKNHYALNSVDAGERFALTYNAQSKLTTSQNLAITTWIRPQFTTGDTADYVFIDGTAELDLSTGLSIATSLAEMKVKINGNTSVTQYPQPLENGVWYGLVINLNNQTNEFSVNVYRLDPNSNRSLPHQKTNTFAPIINDTVSLSNSVEWNSGKGWSLAAAPLDISNVRIFEKTIEEEQQMNVLQQYVVRDSDLAILTDNAIPSLRLRRYSNPK